MRLVHPTLVGVSSWAPERGKPPPDPLESPRSESQGAPRALRRCTPHVGHGLLPRLLRSLTTGDRRGTSSVRSARRFLQVTPPSTRHVLHGESSTPQRKGGHEVPTPALQTREDPSAPARPHRDASRSLTAWPLHRRPYGTTLAAYPSRGRVRAMTAVRGRTRTGRIWFRGTSPFET